MYLIGIHPSSRNNIGVGVEQGASNILLSSALSTVSRVSVSVLVSPYHTSELSRMLLIKRELLRTRATWKKWGPKQISGNKWK